MLLVAHAVRSGEDTLEDAYSVGWGLPHHLERCGGASPTLQKGYRPLGERHFGRQVKRVFKKVERKQKGGKGGRYTVYIGIIKYK